MTGNIVGVFVLGILVGWLVEWLFITFVMGKKLTDLIVKPVVTPATGGETVTQTQSQPSLVVENTQVQAVVSNASSNDAKQDDFMQLKGIGPKLSESIKSININRYDELAAFTGEELLETLEASGAIIVNRPAFVHIPKQAALAAKGDWDALSILKTSI